MLSLVKSRGLRWLSLGLVSMHALVGSAPVKTFRFGNTVESTPSYHRSFETQIEYPGVRSTPTPAVVTTQRPMSLEDPSELPAQDIELSEAIHTALAQSEIFRSLGGSVVRTTQGTATSFDPALAETNPLGGVEAALSAFDAQVASQLFWQVNDRPNNINVNPILLQFQAPAFQQTLASFNYEIAKRTATGARFAARHNIGYDLANTGCSPVPTLDSSRRSIAILYCEVQELSSTGSLDRTRRLDSTTVS